MELGLKDFKGTHIEKCYQQQISMSEQLQKGFSDNVISQDSFCKAMDDLELLEKGKRANIGEIREWSGKKYRKEANGKWLEVSEHGMTKKEHEAHHDKLKEGAAKFNDSNSQFHKDHINRANESLQSSKKLSDKEHSDEEVGITKKKKPSEVKKDR